MMRFGIAEVDVTPGESFLLGGVLNAPRAAGVRWPLNARVALFESRDRRVAVIGLDLLCLLADAVHEVRTAVGPVLRADVGDIMVACSHTHRGPLTASLMGAPMEFDYLDFLVARVEACARAAVDSLEPASLHAGRAAAAGWTFNRRPVYRGEQVATYGPAHGERFLRVEGPTDDEIQVVAARANDGRVLGGLVNYASHPTIMTSEPVYSADYPGALAEELAKRFQAPFVFLLGASGDLAPSATSSDAVDSAAAKQVSDAPKQATSMGRGLANAVKVALEGARDVPAVFIDVARTLVPVGQRRARDEHVVMARRFLEGASPDSPSPREFSKAVYAGEYTFADEVQHWFGPENADHRVLEELYARELIGMWEWQQRAGTRELIEDLEVQVFGLGDLALVGVPVELFAEHGLQIKADSPFSQTLVSTLANGYHGYAPSLGAFARGGYEPRFAYFSRLVPQAADLVVGSVVGLLRELPEERG
jgi:hypothetical protein